MKNQETDKIEVGRFLDISNDYAFKLIFGKEENKHLLRQLINSFIPDRQTINHFYSRVLYYGSLLYASTAKAGDYYYEKLKPAYVISIILSPLKEPEFEGLNDLVLWYQMCEKTHNRFAPNGINIIFANAYRAADSVENCKSEGEKWCQIIRDMSKYTCEPSEVGGGHWKELATLSQSCLYKEETIVEYIKSVMDEKYNRPSKTMSLSI